MTESIQHRGWLIAQALTPVLDRAPNLSGSALNDTLARFSEDGTILKLMFRPDASRTGSFYFIASAPAISAQQLDSDLDILARHGILKSLGDSCSWDSSVELRYQQADGAEEILTSIIPIKGRLGCWVLISAHSSSGFLSTAIGRPYWQTDGVKMAALVYLVFAIFALLIAVSVRRALRHFRQVAHEIRRGGTGSVSFASRNTLPELASVAEDFDRLVEEMHRVAFDIRRTAEDNAHAVKTPLAIIRSALHPLKRTIPVDDHRSLRSVELIEASLTRLSALVSTAQRLGNDTADFIEAPKLRVNLTQVVAEGLLNAQDISADRNIRFVRRLADDVCVLAPEGILDIIVENILDNAISFTHAGGTITTTLSQSAGQIELNIEDEGPGIEPTKIEGIFERHVSIRPPSSGDGDEPEHAGLGLWITRRHTEALGGRVAAINRPDGGLRIQVSLPINGW